PLDGGFLGDIDWNRPHPSGQEESVPVMIDEHHDRGSPKDRRVRRHETDRTGTEYDDRLARLDMSQLGRVVSGRENVRKHDVVVLLLLGIGRKTEAVEIPEWNGQEFRLSP